MWMHEIFFIRNHKILALIFHSGVFLHGVSRGPLAKSEMHTSNFKVKAWHDTTQIRIQAWNTNIYVDFGDFVWRLSLSLVGFFFSFIKCDSVKNFTLFGGQTIKIYRPLRALLIFIFVSCRKSTFLYFTCLLFGVR